MQLQLITVAAALLCAVAAIPCSEIGWSTGRNGEIPPTFLDPFDPQGRWEVVNAKDCWVRFQTHQPGQNPIDVRITKTKFTATPEQVLSTINNFFNIGDRNLMLWFPMRTQSFQYANILPEHINDDFPVVEAQSSIVKARTILSIILPSGKRKLREVGPATPPQGESNENRIRAGRTGFTGLEGEISPEDWAYTTASEAQLVLLSIYNEQYHAYLERRPRDMRNAWLTAEKADKNECVVIDFRDFQNFILRAPRRQ